LKQLSEKILGIAPSATMALNTKANELISSGKNVLKFGIGEPDFSPPDNVINAAAEAAKNAKSSNYSAAGGLPELKEAIINKLKRENNLEYNEKQISVNNGAKHSLFNIALALLNPEDEMIVPKPAWVTYKEQIEFAGGKTVFVETDEEYKLHAEEIEKAITEKTKAILLNTPNNPSGSVFENSELEKIAELAVSNDIYIISDEVYEHFLYDGKEFKSMAAFGEEIKERTLTVNAPSKTYAMPGWRVGYVAGPENIIKAINSMQSHSTSNVCNIAQTAAAEAMNGPQDKVKQMVAEFDSRRKYVVEKLNEIRGIECPRPEGAFYAFPKINGLFNGKIKNSMEFCNYLLEEALVAVVPGTPFENENCIRFSYASSMDSIAEGIERIKKAVEKL
jgi:aspartate aminotransferase